jgi:hypothetical protein
MDTVLVVLFTAWVLSKLTSNFSEAPDQFKHRKNFGNLGKSARKKQLAERSNSKSSNDKEDRESGDEHKAESKDARNRQIVDIERQRVLPVLREANLAADKLLVKTNKNRNV